VGENDDGPDGTTNSLLFARISEAGTYTVRVQAYAGSRWRKILSKGSSPYGRFPRERPLSFRPLRLSEVTLACYVK
jgi:hypothetical protein